MKIRPQILFICLALLGLQSLTSETRAAHNGGGVDNGFGPGINSASGNGNGGGNGSGNNGNGGGNGGATAASGGAQGAPAPILAASIFGQAIALGGCVMAWRRRKTRKMADNKLLPQ